MTTIPPNNFNYVQPTQTVAPTQGTPANATNLYQQQSQQMNNTQQATQPQLVNTTNASALANAQGQYIQAITPTATPTAPVDRLGLINTSTVGGINDFVREAYNMSQAYTTPQVQAQAVAPAVAPQVVSPTQQVQPASTPVAQTVNTQVAQTQQQQQMTTVQPTTASSSTNANPLSQSQQTAPQVGQSDGQGNILWRNPQGQLQWMPQQELMKMYEGGTAYKGKILLADGKTWVDEETARRVKEKIEARLQLAKLKQDGKISDQEFKLAGGDQDLSGILGSTQQTKNAKALARMKEAASGSRDIADLGGASPYSSFSPSVGGGSETG
jgi:hypothetical protein